MIKKLCILLLNFFGLQASEPVHSADNLPLIVDTDMGNDDVMALLSLLRKPNVSIKAITVTGTGLAHAEEGLRNMRHLLHLSNRSGIPTAFGRATPLKGENSFPHTWRARSDSLLDHLPRIDINCDDPSCNAVELLRDTLESTEEKIAILALGPLTNIAELFRLYPELIKKVEKLHVMGGAVDVPGNLLVVEGNHDAEWNIFADPTAAQEVFQAGIPIYLIALDVTNQTQLTMDYYEYVEKNRKTPSSNLFYYLLTDIKNQKTMHQFNFWDLIAVETLIDPSLAQYEQRTIRVITDEGSECGRTMPSDAGSPVQLATKIDSKKFLQVYFDTINSQ